MFAFAVSPTASDGLSHALGRFPRKLRENAQTLEVKNQFVQVSDVDSTTLDGNEFHRTLQLVRVGSVARKLVGERKHQGLE